MLVSCRVYICQGKYISLKNGYTAEKVNMLNAQENYMFLYNENMGEVKKHCLNNPLCKYTTYPATWTHLENSLCKKGGKPPFLPGNFKTMPFLGSGNPKF